VYAEAHITASDESAESTIQLIDAAGTVLDSVSVTNDADKIYWVGNQFGRLRITDAVAYAERPNQNRITYLKIAGTGTNPFTASNC
jgi:hypothetical protein